MASVSVAQFGRDITTWTTPPIAPEALAATGAIVAERFSAAGWLVEPVNDVSWSVYTPDHEQLVGCIFLNVDKPAGWAHVEA